MSEVDEGVVARCNHALYLQASARREGALANFLEAARYLHHDPAMEAEIANLSGLLPQYGDHAFSVALTHVDAASRGIIRELLVDDGILGHSQTKYPLTAAILGSQP